MIFFNSGQAIKRVGSCFPSQHFANVDDNVLMQQGGSEHLLFLRNLELCLSTRGTRGAFIVSFKSG